MGALDLLDRFGEYERIGLDSPVFIYHLNRQQPYFSLCGELLRRIETGRLRAVMSVVNEMEILSAPGIASGDRLVNDVEHLLRRLAGLEIAPVDRTIARRAARLRAESRLRGIDALVAATSTAYGCRYLVGNDREFAARLRGLDYLLLDDYVDGYRIERS